MKLAGNVVAIPIVLGNENLSYWSWKSRPKGLRRSRVTQEIRDLIRQMSRANPLWGAPRIHGELLKLGVAVSQAAVSKYMVRSRKPPSQSWRAFLANHARDIVSIGFFTVPTVTFRVLFAFLVMGNQRREVIHFNGTESPTAAWTRQQMIDAVPCNTAPRFVVPDRDGIYADDFLRRVGAMRVEQVVIAAYSPKTLQRKGSALRGLQRFKAGRVEWAYTGFLGTTARRHSRLHPIAGAVAMGSRMCYKPIDECVRHSVKYGPCGCLVYEIWDPRHQAASPFAKGACDE